MIVVGILLMILFYFICAFFVSAGLLYALRVPARRFGFVDSATGQDRKQHSGRIPPLGGVVVFPVGVFLSALAGFDWLMNWPLLLALSMLLAIGVVDDFRAISSTLRLMVQIMAACLLVIPGGAEIVALGDLLGLGPVELSDGKFGLLSSVFSIFCMVLLINSLNMIDGLDGLSGGIGVIMLGFLLALALMLGGAFVSFVPLFLVFIGAIGGFYVMNMRFPWQKKAKVFFGDSGTLALGALIGWGAIGLYNQAETAIPSMTMGWILAFPVMDAFALFVLRVKQKRSPFSADRFHVHYILRDRGGRVSACVIGLHLLHILYGAIGVFCYFALLNQSESNGQWAEWMFFYPWLLLLCAHSALVFYHAAIKAE